jgi:hypothetical protein
MTKTIQVRVPDEVYTKLEMGAAFYRVTLSLLVRNILTAYLENTPVRMPVVTDGSDRVEDK